MNKLVSGSIFDGKYPIVQLNIQAPYGIKFYLNNSTFPIIINDTGVYNIELNSLIEITHLCFDAESMNLLNKNNDFYLIIDYVYETEEK